MISPVLAALSQARLHAAPMFVRWCDLNGISPCPAAPAAVAQFVADCASLGVERLWPAVLEISKLHLSAGLADPTRAGPAAEAIAEISGIETPRSWPADRRQHFKSLPYDLQVFIAAHEAQREKALRRAQNRAAAAEKKLATLQQSPNPTERETTDEAIPHTTA